MTKTIENNPNLATPPRLDELPKEATTVTDASDRVPAFKEANGVSYKGPDELSHSEADRVAISRAHGTVDNRPWFPKRGSGGKMGREWG